MESSIFPSSMLNNVFFPHEYLHFTNNVKNYSTLCTSSVSKWQIIDSVYESISKSYICILHPYSLNPFISLKSISQLHRIAMMDRHPHIK